MKDKKIIDGVNVIKCSFLDEDLRSCNNSEWALYTCKGNNCYYKQLQKVVERNLKVEKALKNIKDIVNEACKTEDYLMGQEFTDLVDKISSIYTKLSKTLK